MGATELVLLVKYGIPLIAKLLADGKDLETVTSVVGAVVDVVSDDAVVEVLVGATDEQAKGIVEMLFGLITSLLGGKK